MTTMTEEEVECCLCRAKSVHTIIHSTNAFGSMDLDTRPPEMERSTIWFVIKRCPLCGYCSPNLSECDGKRKMKTLVASEDYQRILSDAEMPNVAASFLAWSYLQQQSGKYGDAAWSAMHAVWVCDDESKVAASKICREKAIALIQLAKSHKQKFARQKGMAEAITVDLMRRAGLLVQAFKLIEDARVMEIKESIVKVLDFQKQLIANNDRSGYTFVEALGEDWSDGE